MEKKINSISELSAFVKQLLDAWYKKFLLYGDLWVGKTEFTKQLAKHLWIANISSPTYTYINNYDNKLLHGDFYRISSQEEFVNLWLIDEILDYDYVVIEWPKFENLYVDENFLKLEIKKNPDSSRTFVWDF